VAFCPTRTTTLSTGMMTLDEFFAGREVSRRIFDALKRAIDDLGPSELRVTESQVAFCREKPYAWAWVPGMVLRGDQAPLVLTLCPRRRDASDRWEEVVEPRTGRFTHHLELHSAAEIDREVRACLLEA
jgi:hypothetical protein